MLLSDPTLFSAYVLGSPSLWHGQNAIFATEAAYAEANHDMVADNARFEQRLKARRYPGLSLTNEVLATRIT